jgi:hypothetical protein
MERRRFETPDSTSINQFDTPEARQAFAAKFIEDLQSKKAIRQE